MKSLPTLIKLASQRVNEQRLRLAKYEEIHQKLKNDIKRQEDNLKFEAERAKSDPMLSLQYGRYAQEVEERIKTLQENRLKNETKLMEEQNRLSMLFKEQKTLEVYKDQQQEKIKKEKEKRDQNNMDELAARLKKYSYS